MKLFSLLSAFIFAFTLTISTPAHATVSPDKVVKDFYNSLQKTMKQGEKLGFDGRFKKLAPAVKKTFNLPLMTRYSVGRTWSKATKSEKKQLIQAFTNFSIATYASRFKKYDGEKFEVLSFAPSGKKATMVVTHLTPEGEAPVKLNYLVRKDKKGVYRIADVYLDASISELATRRSDFSAVIRRDGLSALITMLQNKAKAMKEKSTK